MGEEVSTEKIEEMNRTLKEASTLLYGDGLRIQVVNPKEVIPLKKNARYMLKQQFDQLVENLRKDQRLESVPLCYEMPNGRIQVLSGNHRVKAAVSAGIQRILVLVICEEMTVGKKRAKQLSHNAISGQDDIQILADIWIEMNDLQDKLYSGLDSETIKEIEKFSFEGFGAQAIRTEQVTFWFLPEEVERLDELIEDCALKLQGDVYMAPLKAYDKLWQAIVNVKKHLEIKNTAVALMILIDRLEKSSSTLEEEVRQAAAENPDEPPY